MYKAFSVPDEPPEPEVKESERVKSKKNYDDEDNEDGDDQISALSLNSDYSDSMTLVSVSTEGSGVRVVKEGGYHRVRAPPGDCAVVMSAVKMWMEDVAVLFPKDCRDVAAATQGCCAPLPLLPRAPTRLDHAVEACNGALDSVKEGIDGICDDCLTGTFWDKIYRFFNPAPTLRVLPAQRHAYPLMHTEEVWFQRAQLLFVNAAFYPAMSDHTSGGSTRTLILSFGRRFQQASMPREPGEKCIWQLLDEPSGIHAFCLDVSSDELRTCPLELVVAHTSYGKTTGMYHGAVALGSALHQFSPHAPMGETRVLECPMRNDLNPAAQGGRIRLTISLDVGGAQDLYIGRKGHRRTRLARDEAGPSILSPASSGGLLSPISHNPINISGADLYDSQASLSSLPHRADKGLMETQDEHLDAFHAICDTWETPDLGDDDEYQNNQYYPHTRTELQQPQSSAYDPDYGAHEHQQATMPTALDEDNTMPDPAMFESDPFMACTANGEHMELLPMPPVPSTVQTANGVGIKARHLRDSMVKAGDKDKDKDTATAEDPAMAAAAFRRRHSKRVSLCKAQSKGVGEGVLAHIDDIPPTEEAAPSLPISEAENDNREELVREWYSALDAEENKRKGDMKWPHRLKGDDFILAKQLSKEHNQRHDMDSSSWREEDCGEVLEQQRKRDLLRQERLRERAVGRNVHLSAIAHLEDHMPSSLVEVEEASVGPTIDTRDTRTTTESAADGEGALGTGGEMHEERGHQLKELCTRDFMVALMMEANFEIRPGDEIGEAASLQLEAHSEVDPEDLLGWQVEVFHKSKVVNPYPNPYPNPNPNPNINPKSKPIAQPHYGRVRRWCRPAYPRLATGTVLMSAPDWA